MAKYQKLVNRAEVLMTAWAARYQYCAQLDKSDDAAADKALEALNNTRNALLGFIGSLAGRNDQQQETIGNQREGIEALKAELATYKPQIPDGLPFDLEAAKAGAPIQVRREVNGVIDWLDATFIGLRDNGDIVFETKEFGIMHTKTYAGLRMMLQTEQVTFWANVYPESYMAVRCGHLYKSAHDANVNANPEAIAVAVPVTITVAK